MIGPTAQVDKIQVADTDVFVNKFRNGTILLENEESIVSAFQKQSAASEYYSGDTNDWLYCQKILNELMTMIVNGDSGASKTYAADWIYRFLYRNPRLWRGRLRGVAGIGKFSRRICKYLTADRITVEDVYATIKEAEEFLCQPPSEVLTKSESCVIGRNTSQGAPHPIVGEMCRLLYPVSESVSVYLHGSMATGDYTAFSDVDDLVIVHNSSWNSYRDFVRVIRCLEKVSKVFQHVDPLQHHGHWVYADYELLCLDDTIMPLLVLRDSVIVVGRDRLDARVRTRGRSFGCVLWAIVQDVRRDALALANGSLNLYGLKNLVSGLSLLPALVFQVHGQMVDKKTAILRGEEVFSERALEALDWATNVRQAWASCEGYVWVRRLGYINRMLPFRRSTLEAIARSYLPCLSVREIPHCRGEVVKAIFEFSNECVHKLKGVVDN